MEVGSETVRYREWTNVQTDQRVGVDFRLGVLPDLGKEISNQVLVHEVHFSINYLTTVLNLIMTPGGIRPFVILV